MPEKNPCEDPNNLCVFNCCSLAFWSFIVIVFELILLALSLPFSLLEAFPHFLQIVLLLIGLLGLYSGCCYHHFVRFYAIAAYPLTAITIFSLTHYSDQLTGAEIAEALSFYYPGIEIAIAYIIGVLQPYSSILTTIKLIILWFYGMGTAVALFRWQNAATAQFIYFDCSRLDTWIGVVVHLVTIFTGLDHEELGNITSASQLVWLFIGLLKSILNSDGSLLTQLQDLLGGKKKGRKGMDEGHATWNRSSERV